MARWLVASDSLITSWRRMHSPNVGLRSSGTTSSGNQLRTYSAHSSVVTGGPPGTKPASSAGATYLRMVLRFNAERVGNHELGSPRVPVLEDLHDVDHSERPPYHLGSLRPGTTRSVVGSETEEADFRLTGPVGNSVTGRVANYLTELRPGWGIP